MTVAEIMAMDMALSRAISLIVQLMGDNDQDEKTIEELKSLADAADVARSAAMKAIIERVS
jgi:50S ribosomal subunit-associated GTPase HflX